MPTPVNEESPIGNRISVLIPLAEAPLQDVLSLTLGSLGFADEILAADMVGLYPEECAWMGEAVTHLPYQGLPETAAMYRAALTAKNEWLLILEPGLAVPPELIAKLRQWDGETEGTAVRFGRMWFWHEAQWMDPPAGIRADWIRRDVYLAHVKQWRPLPLTDREELLSGPIAPTDLLRWADYEGYRVAQQMVKDDGPPASAMKPVHKAIREAIRLTLQDGVGHRLAFDRTGRVVLLCRLLKTIGIGLALSTFAGKAGTELQTMKVSSRQRSV